MIEEFILCPVSGLCNSEGKKGQKKRLELIYTTFKYHNTQGVTEVLLPAVLYNQSYVPNASKLACVQRFP